MEPCGQGTYAVRLDWGRVGALACAADLSIVVDVLSFSTSVTVAVEKGAQVFPCPWRDPRAEEFARSHDAVLAVGRLEATKLPGPPAPSISPSGLLDGPSVPRLVLPSPNGSSISAALRDQGSQVAVGCLRNASAAAELAAAHLDAGRTVALIAAGERWAADDSLRPALEDHLGAGAISQRLCELGYEEAMSPESIAAGSVFAAVESRVGEVLRTCVGGRELADRGFGKDVNIAADLDATALVPLLREGSFQSA